MITKELFLGANGLRFLTTAFRLLRKTTKVRHLDAAYPERRNKDLQQDNFSKSLAI